MMSKNGLKTRRRALAGCSLHGLNGSCKWKRGSASCKHNEGGQSIDWPPTFLPLVPRLSLCAATDHEAVEAIFGDLPPQVFVAPERRHGVQHLFIVSICRGSFGVHFVRSLQAG